MGKLGKMMASCVKGVSREEASFNFKLNMKNRLAMHLERIKV